MTQSDSKHLMSPQPLYIQIKDTLKQRILEGIYAPHERLPSESELMAAFKVSRITVRQALRDLHSEGLIFTSQGKGTYASKPKAVQDVHRLEGFGEAMTAKGYETSAQLLSLKEVSPNKDVQDKLQLSTRAKVIEVSRVRHLNGEPVSLDISYFPLDIGTRLVGKDITGDIFPLLENRLGVQLGGADISLEARCADATVAKHLKLEAGSPVMWVERLTHDVKGRPIDYEYLAFKGDAYRYHFKVERNQ